MKRINSYLGILMCLLGCIVFAGCSDNDSDKQDSLLASQLPGRWEMSFSDQGKEVTVAYVFTEDSFTYSSSSVENMGLEIKTVRISGGWNIRKETLQLNYDLATLRTDGMTQAEAFVIKDGFHKDNLLLADLNSVGRPYGQTMEFGRQDGVRTLRLSNFNGLFLERP